jgi:hypothetical protein
MNEDVCGWLVCVCDCSACWCNMPPELQAFYRQWPPAPRRRPYRSKCWKCGRLLVEGRNQRCYELKGMPPPQPHGLG